MLIRASTGDPQGAVGSLRQGDRVGRAWLRPTIPRALAHLKAGRTDAAIADYDAALRIDPTLAAAPGAGAGRKIRRGADGWVAPIVAAAKASGATSPRNVARYGVRQRCSSGWISEASS